MKQQIQLSDHFTYKRLLQFVLPSIASVIFTSIYGVVDGFFVSNFVGKDPFTGLNIIMPFIIILGAVGNMIGIGGSALIAKILGEGENEKANRLFSFFVYFMIFISTIFALIGFMLVPQIASFLGAEGEVLKHAIVYGRIMMIGNIFFSLQYTFQGFLITAEQPKVNFRITVAAGMTNIIFDAIFIALFKWGIAGAALATIAGQLVGSLTPMYLFATEHWILRLGKPEIDFKALLKACTNGSSEFLSNISMSSVGILLNLQLLKYAGNDGVAAYGVIMYVNMIFIAIFFGYCMGTSPIIGYNYGSKNTDELKNIFKKSMVLMTLVSVMMLVSAELLAKPLAFIFTSYDQELMDMTIHAFRIFSISFVFSGIGIFGSSMFTALNNGLISAFLSVERTVILQVIFVCVLPLLWGIDGVWWSIVFAEGISMLITLVFVFIYRNRYQYM